MPVSIRSTNNQTQDRGQRTDHVGCGARVVYLSFLFFDLCVHLKDVIWKESRRQTTDDGQEKQIRH